MYSINWCFIHKCDWHRKLGSWRHVRGQISPTYKNGVYIQINDRRYKSFDYYFSICITFPGKLDSLNGRFFDIMDLIIDRYQSQYSDKRQQSIRNKFRKQKSIIF